MGALGRYRRKMERRGILGGLSAGILATGSRYYNRRIFLRSWNRVKTLGASGRSVENKQELVKGRKKPAAI